VNYVAYIARTLSAKLNFINVAVPAKGYAMPIYDNSEFQTYYKKEMQRRIEELVAETQVRCQGSTGEVVTGDPAREIVDYAKSNNANLIIISTHGANGLEIILNGSVAREVIKHAHCPVPVMNPFKRASQDN
jgi:nucleotide-binding universal stress UspA family protein